MMTIRWFRSGASPRGTPAFRRPKGRYPAVFLILGVATLSQAGCATSPCNGCGSGIGTRMRSVSERAFQSIKSLKPSGCSTCGSGSALGAEGVSVMPYGGTVVTPGTAAPAGTVAPGATDTTTPDLTPIPNAVPGPPPEAESGSSTGAKGGTTKSSYEAFRPKYDPTAQANSGGLARSLNSSPAPTTRSAQGSSHSKPGMERSPLDDLGPIDVPGDLSQREASPPPLPTAAREGGVAPAAEARALAAKAAAMNSATVSLAPGIRRFVGVESKLAGGSLPDAAGLNWLSEKGFKTILDLREETDLAPGFVADVARRGLRYVALPIRAKAIDADLVSRFEIEISMSEGRPLYFCDADGTRAGALWLIHRVLVDKVDPIVARRDAEDLGLFSDEFVRAAEAYLDRAKANASGEIKAPAPAAAPAPNPNSNTAPPPPIPATLPTGACTNTPEAPSAGPSPSADASDETEGQVPGERPSWRPMMAMLATGVGVPLAFLSRSAITFNLRAIARASLPARGSSVKSLPHGSDAGS
jgi:protein tyrosine phosphatase (PTP) superfamily phosphohydrolase (DUF442 family)